MLVRAAEGHPPERFLQVCLRPLAAAANGFCLVPREHAAGVGEVQLRALVVKARNEQSHTW